MPASATYTMLWADGADPIGFNCVVGYRSNGSAFSIARAVVANGAQTVTYSIENVSMTVPVQSVINIQVAATQVTL